MTFFLQLFMVFKNDFGLGGNQKNVLLPPNGQKQDGRHSHEKILILASPNKRKNL
jgi:hypothetical protein